VCPPAYYAHLAALRGKLMCLHSDESDTASSTGTGAPPDYIYGHHMTVSGFTRAGCCLSLRNRTAGADRHHANQAGDFVLNGLSNLTLVDAAGAGARAPVELISVRIYF